MNLKQLLKHKRLFLVFFAVLLSLSAAFAVAPTQASVKFNLTNFVLEPGGKKITFDIYVQDVDPNNVIKLSSYALQFKIPQSVLGSQPKTITATGSDLNIGVGSVLSNLINSNADWGLKIPPGSPTSSFANSTEVSTLPTQTRLAHISISNTDGSAFPKPGDFSISLTGSSIGTKSTVLILIDPSTVSADGSVAMPESNFTGLGAYALVAAQTQLTVAAPSITLSKTYDGSNSATVTAGALSGVLTGDAGNVTLQAVATYNNALAGSGKTITVAYSLTGSAAGNYLAPANTVVTNGVITALPLTVSAPSFTTSKAYDATTSATVTVGTLSGVLLADAGNVGVSANATYNNANIGSGKTITAVYALSGSAAGNYTAPSNSVVTNGIITALSTTAGAPIITLSKPYDATKTAAVTAGSLSGVLPADAGKVSLVAVGTYDNANTGSSKNITVTYSLTGASAGNYVAPANYSVGNGEITVSASNQLTVTSPTITLSKPYDGNTTAVVTAGTLSGVAVGDVANVTLQAVATYNNALAGSGKTITVAYSLTGSAAGNYLAPANTVVTNGVITALPLTVSAPSFTTSKAYDATTSATVTVGTLSGVLLADAGNVGVSANATYNNANIGSGKTITAVYALSGSAAGNYTAPSNSVVTNGIITALSTTAGAPIITLSKPYDATKTAAVTAGSLSGVLPADAGKVSLVAVGTYDNANTGSSKNITVTYSLTGASAGNYVAPANYSVGNGEITVSASNQLTVTSPTITLSKPYDGNTTAVVTAGTLSGVAVGDVANVTLQAVATYNNALAGSGKTITVAYSLTGSAAGNYLAPANTVVTNGVITALTLTASAPNVTLSKSYDGTASAAVVAGTLSGVLPTDAGNVVLVASATYDNANAGSNKTITVTYSLTGSAAGNYTAPANNVVTSGEIVSTTKKLLTVGEPTVTLSKEYDGTTKAAVVAGALVGVAPADAANVGINASADYVDASAGKGKTIKVKYSLTGSAADKYSIASEQDFSGEILRKQLTISNIVVETSKTIDGNTMAVITSLGTLNGVLPIDTDLKVKAFANYDNSKAGSGKNITVTYTLTGTSKDNYLAPKDSVINNGLITSNIILSILEYPKVGVEGADMQLKYTVEKGKPVEYKIVFGDDAHKAGFKDIDYTNFTSTDSIDVASFGVQQGAPAGTYQGTLYVRDQIGSESAAYTFQFTVYLTSDLIVKVYDDLLTIDNSSDRFVNYQWYKDGVLVPNATKQFFSEESGLNGTYSVQVTTMDGKVYYSYPKTIEIAQKKAVSAAPSLIKASQEFSIKAEGFNSQELENATLSIHTVQGVCVYRSSHVEYLNKLSLPLEPKMYIGHVKVKDGSEYAFKFIVEN